MDLRGDGEGAGAEIIIKLGKRGSLRENLTPRPPLYHQLLQCASLVEFDNLERKRPCCGTKTKMELSAVELYGRRKNFFFLGRGGGEVNVRRFKGSVSSWFFGRVGVEREREPLPAGVGCWYGIGEI